ncbi:MAG TPA: response regulator [Mogibacterium sp.]|nr:response regulator [Mogibacterium sp.]
MISKYSYGHTVTKQIINALKAHVVRSRTAIAAVFLGVYNESEFDVERLPETLEKITVFLKNETRNTDMVFSFAGKLKWLIILSQSGEREATAFLRRLYVSVKNNDILDLENQEILFSASVAEIGNDEGSFEKLVTEGTLALTESLSKGPEQIEYVTTFKKRPLETVKVSILEENDVFRKVLYRTIENLNLNNFETEIKEFQDGYEFLESDWYFSSHTHLIIMNDILPRQSGLDVLHKIRMLPNNKKFIVFMMTKRSSEEDMIYAYESGADNYFIKPFNLRLLEVEIKRTLERLWT